jgi:tRNA U38,U39,U40 pseudouridine synthase TruA
MIHSAEIEQVLAKAKQQRAEYIGSAARTHAGLVAAGVALSLAVMTFISEPAPDAALGQEGGAQVATQQT